METENENATPPPKKKTKCSHVINDIYLEKENGTSKTCSTPVDPNKRTCNVEKEGKMAVVCETLPPNHKIIVVDVETLENNVVFLKFIKGSRDPPMTLFHIAKSGIMEFYKIIEWVYSEMESLKSKQVEFSKKVDTLRVVGTANLSSLPNYLNELTKAISDMEALTRAYGSQFKVVEARFNNWK